MTLQLNKLACCGRISVLLGAAWLTAGCSLLPGYQQGMDGDVQPLEVPPDLIKPQGGERLAIPTLPEKTAGECPPGSQTALPAIEQRVLPAQKGVRIVREGRYRWLQVEVEPEQLWPLARKFLLDRGYAIAQDEPKLGLLETDWKAREVGGTESQWRERLRLRVEPSAAPGFSEVYVSQLLAELGSDDQWQLHAPDEERAVEMLNRLAGYLGGENVSQSVPLKSLDAKMDRDEDDNLALRVAAPFEMVWRRTGIAVDKLGFTIEDHNRSTGTYRIYTEVSSGKTEEEVKYGKPESATVRDEYQLLLREADGGTVIIVQDKNGKPDNSQPARHLLTMLQGQFR